IRPARLNPIEAVQQRLVLRRGCAAVFDWRGVGVFECFPPVAGDFVRSAKSWAMKTHGAAAMAVLVLIGMLLTGHVRFAWRARRNRGNGLVFLSAFAVVTVTGYGLYYAGGESLRAWTSWIHLAVGLALPLVLILHVWLGKKTRPPVELRKPPGPVAK